MNRFSRGVLSDGTNEVAADFERPCATGIAAFDRIGTFALRLRAICSPSGSVYRGRFAQSRVRSRKNTAAYVQLKGWAALTGCCGCGILRLAQHSQAIQTQPRLHRSLRDTAPPVLLKEDLKVGE